MKAATIYDVARSAGVSHQTVSRVLRGGENVRATTRAKVQAALDELGYRPNDAARALRTRRINRIGVLVDAIEQAGPALTLAGAAAAAREHGYVLDTVSMVGDDRASIMIALDLVAEHQVAGVVATAQTDDLLAAIRASAGPVPSVVDITLAPEGFDMTHDESIGALAADHLLGLGHRRAGYISGPEAWGTAQLRSRGFLDRFTAGGGEVVWRGSGDWSAESGAIAGSEFARRRDGATALASANDEMAIGALAALSDAGLRIPRDVSLVGTDDIPIARQIRPALTTIAIDFAGEGRRLIEQLLVDLGELAPDRAHSPRVPRLVPRASTAPVDG